MLYTDCVYSFYLGGFGTFYWLIVFTNVLRLDTGHRLHSTLVSSPTPICQIQSLRRNPQTLYLVRLSPVSWDTFLPGPLDLSPFSSYFRIYCLFFFVEGRRTVTIYRLTQYVKRQEGRVREGQREGTGVIVGEVCHSPELSSFGRNT